MGWVVCTGGCHMSEPTGCHWSEPPMQGRLPNIYSQVLVPNLYTSCQSFYTQVVHRILYTSWKMQLVYAYTTCVHNFFIFGTNLVQPNALMRID